MEKRKRWQKLVILGVLFLTVYNILPTVFFYSKQLKNPVAKEDSTKISSEIMQRVNRLEDDAQSWLGSFCKSLHLKPQAIILDSENPGHISVTFKNTEEADTFRSALPRAGSLISFVPSQLSLYNTGDITSKTVVLQRKIPLHFTADQQENFFQFSEKYTENGSVSPLYRALVFDRAMQLGMAVGGPSENASLIQAAAAKEGGPDKVDLTMRIAQNILSHVKVFGESGENASRYFASFSQIDTPNRDAFIQNFIQTLTQTKDQLKLERISLQSEAQFVQAKGEFLETVKQQRLEQLTAQEKTLEEAEELVKKHRLKFAAGKAPWTYESLSSKLEMDFATMQEKGSKVQTLSLAGRNPFVEAFTIDWSSETIELNLFADLASLKEKMQAQGKLYQKEQIDQSIYNEIAHDSRLSGESIKPQGKQFLVKLNQLEGSKSFLTMRLSAIANARSEEIYQSLIQNWTPKHPDLKGESFPVWDYATYQQLPAHERKLGLLIYAPACQAETPKHGLHNNSIYVIAKGLDKIFQKVQASPNSDDSKQFFKDFNSLKVLLQQYGMFGYPGNTLATSDLDGHFVFEAEDFYLPVLSATREDFVVKGTKRFATLEFTNREQRLLTQNKIENHIHEDLLKWRDDYHAAKLGISGVNPYDVPKPTKSAFFNNLALSCKKYFRGDDRKILHWGLDLSGGKTVQIELRDQNNRQVIGDDEINQGINELYERVNKMGVSEVSIRREGNLITLDFPGSQELSASELIKASTMYFHIVNEKFDENNPALKEESNQFLQDVWNEAVVTGCKTAEEINQIAWRHMHGDSFDPDVLQPRSQAARTLYENGLRLESPQDHTGGNDFNDAVSMIAIQRGEDFTQWRGKTHPLTIVFRNFAVEGANLKNVQASYDPNKGNSLNFEIKGKETLKTGEKILPREDLYSWTSQFSKDKIAGTPNASYSSGEGWRMAVLLNGTVITAPTLNYPIKEGGMIEGSFTQREAAQLEADLKAGSLSFTPRILSEKNVSPEIGAKERNFGILATMIALALVVACMVAYYRFGGLIASIAVIVNLLIMWATLQNLGATLTLATIAGGILTLGMAVDANVLVFERIREEFAITGRIASAVHAGYRKAFSAILDSNVTTIIAALILMQFDSGPIKGFAITLIIGIASSMFTALFMTRFFFTGWVNNPKHTKLSMSQFIKASKFNFMKFGKLALGASTVIVLAGGYLFFQQRNTIMGMDFTGGYSLNLEMEKRAEGDYREVIEKALIAAGANAQDFQVRQLTPETHIRLFLGKGMQQAGKPFFGMPMENALSEFTHAYENNPRISWVVDSLQKQGALLSVDSLQSLDQNFSEISGQLSDSMRTSALTGLGLAILCILVYITIRFEFKYAISATLCLAHDIGITLAVLAILSYFGVAIQIDLNTVAALMTIVGYSLNDTIIVFDRVREDTRLMRKSSFIEIMNHALNVTLSRTVMTSCTTMLVLLPLIFLGGSTIFAFSLVMVIGVVFGTLSSLFIAAPMLNYFHARAETKEKTTPQVAAQ
ncbi:MAG: protein translocase subunit SecD [Simkaniaceae bacterium]|nr:protein translocase subunit SecD [Candidatus Sacchlamyda saccharinae]